MKTRDGIRMLTDDGWVLQPGKGSGHRQFKHPVKPGMETYLIVLGKSPANYSACSPDVPGCVTVGQTVEDTLHHMQDALRSHLAAMAEDGDPLPKPLGLAHHLSVDPDLQDPTLVFAQIPVADVSPLAHA